MFSNDVLADVGPRVLRLRETLSQDGAAAQVVVRYEDHKLILRPQAESSIVVLALHSINLAQLKIALNLVNRSLSVSHLRTTSPQRLETQINCKGARFTEFEFRG